MNKMLDVIFERLGTLEPQLKRFARHGNSNQAHNIMNKIQSLFSTNSDHHKMLQAKNEVEIQ